MYIYMQYQISVHIQWSNYMYMYGLTISLVRWSPRAFLLGLLLFVHTASTAAHSYDKPHHEEKCWHSNYDVDVHRGEWGRSNRASRGRWSSGRDVPFCRWYWTNASIRYLTLSLLLTLSHSLSLPPSFPLPPLSPFSLLPLSSLSPPSLPPLSPWTHHTPVPHRGSGHMAERCVALCCSPVVCSHLHCTCPLPCECSLLPHHS